MSDPVNHPQHYECERRTIQVEPIDLCECFDFCLGNALKYIIRAPHKGHQLEDLRKAQWYLRRCLLRGGPLPESFDWRSEAALDLYSTHPALVMAKRRICAPGERMTWQDIRNRPADFIGGLLAWVNTEVAMLEDSDGD